MTQENAFRAAAGGFIFGFALPYDRGNLRRFKIVRVDARKNDDRWKLTTRIIRALKKDPVRLLVDRKKQLGKLFDSYIERDLRIVIILSRAHLLNPTTINDLRIIGEYSAVLYRKSTPAFVLPGNPDELEVLIEQEPSVRLRSSNLPAPQLRLVKW